MRIMGNWALKISKVRLSTLTRMVSEMLSEKLVYCTQQDFWGIRLQSSLWKVTIRSVPPSAGTSPDFSSSTKDAQPFSAFRTIILWFYQDYPSWSHSSLICCRIVPSWGIWVQADIETLNWPWNPACHCSWTDYTWNTGKTFWRHQLPSSEGPLDPPVVYLLDVFPDHSDIQIWNMPVSQSPGTELCSWRPNVCDVVESSSNHRLEHVEHIRSDSNRDNSFRWSVLIHIIKLLEWDPLRTVGLRAPLIMFVGEVAWCCHTSWWMTHFLACFSWEGGLLNIRVFSFVIISQLIYIFSFHASQMNSQLLSVWKYHFEEYIFWPDIEF